jgi:hypothetical protein
MMVYSSASRKYKFSRQYNGFNATHTKPVAVISWNNGALIKTQLAGSNTVRLAVTRTGAATDRLITRLFFTMGDILSATGSLVTQSIK